MFPDQGMVGRTEIAKFSGVHPTTVDRWVKNGKLKLRTPTGRISKADYARQICI
jgi:predicted site-specific integrase-resolvase